MKKPHGDDAAEIRRRMRSIRGELSSDVRGITARARELADWKYHVRRHPWTAMAVTALAGYMFVPRRKEIISPDAATLAKLADQDRLVVERAPKAKSRGGFADMLIAPITAMLLRSAGNYVSMKFGEFVQSKAEQADDAPEKSAAPPSPTPAAGRRPR